MWHKVSPRGAVVPASRNLRPWQLRSRGAEWVIRRLNNSLGDAKYAPSINEPIPAFGRMLVQFGRPHRLVRQPPLPVHGI